MAESQQLAEENHLTLTAATAKQILSPAVFNNTNIGQLKQICSEKTAKVEDEFIDLKGNVLPAGLTPLEDMFDDNDVPKKPKMEPLNATIEERDIGTTEHPRMIKLSKNLPPDQKPKYVDLFKEFQDVFAWSYEDLKSYDTSVIQHTIPLKPNQKSFKQKLRRINPMLLSLIEKEIKRMFEAGTIAPIRFSEWVSNLVPTIKKIGEIRLCVDLRNLNQVSLKDHYPLPKMDHILQRVVSCSRISLLDGFSGFNQILVHPDDQDKTAFTTPWGTFKYVKMPFGLKNAGATFQRAMDIAFAKEIHDFLVVYLDELTPFSKYDQEHLKHLRQIFMTCRKYGISLNPKKSLFALEEGKILGHIISKYGIRIDPERIQAILQIPYPRNIKELRAFLGKINFLRRFIPNLAELIRLLSNMLKNNAKVKWSLETKQAFESIKTAPTQMPVLTSPQFDKDFIIFSFASDHTIAAVLLQKDDQGNEKPIAFFSRALRDVPLKYQIMEKKVYALVKAIKDFRIYILYSHVIAYVPNAVVKDILTQEGLEGKRGKWIASILEYDIEIKPTKLTKGQGLAKLMSKTNFQALDINQLDNELELATPHISETFMQSPCIMKEFHAGDCGGHLYWKSTADKILRAGYYWPSLFADVKRFGCPEKIIIDNATAFKSKKIINFCHKYHITLGHSIAYYPQGNGLAESSKKSLINIIKKLLEENKKNWHRKLTNALWADRHSTKKSIGMSPSELVYGMEARFPSSLGIPTVKLLQEIHAEPNDMQIRVNQTIHLQQTREQVFNKAQILQEKLKKMFDKNAKEEDFWVGSKVLRWDSRREDKGKHAKLDFLWKGPYIINAVQGNNTYFLKSPDGSTAEEGPVNGRMLKHYNDPFD
eukprot:PITA_15200